MNFRRSISRLDRELLPNITVIYDTESYINVGETGVEIHTLRYVGYTTVRVSKDYSSIGIDDVVISDTIASMVTHIVHLQKRNPTVYVCAHNVSYDMQVSGLLQELLGIGYEVKSWIGENGVVIITLINGRKRIIIYDSYQLTHVSLAQLAKSVGMTKGEVDYYSERDEQLWKEYIKQDVMILAVWFKRYLEWLRDERLGGFAMTLAGQALNAYRARFLPYEIPLHRDIEALDCERNSYMGGRVECFRIGKMETKEYYKLDINSMYPFVMRENEYPTVYLGKVSQPKPEEFQKIREKYYYIVHARVSIDNPCLPYRNDGKLVYPIGEFEWYWHKPEFELAYNHAKNVEIIDVYCYKPAKIFESYVDYFYARKILGKENGDKFMEFTSKLMLNSLYGKFGQRGYESKTIIDDTMTPTISREIVYSERLGCSVTVLQVGTRIIMTYRAGESTYSHPAIAGSVTSYARAYLYMLINTAGIDHVYYTDTDSLIVDDIGYNHLRPYIDEKKLGSLKVEGITNRLIINGLKDYVFGQEVKIKGVGSKARKINDDTYVINQWQSLIGWLKTGASPYSVVTPVTKKLSREYSKGILVEDRIYPLRLDISSNVVFGGTGKRTGR